MSNVIVEALSIDEIVCIINSNSDENVSTYFGGTDTRAAEEMAGQYAWESAKESGYTDDSSIEGQLDCLIEAGAQFDYGVAFKNAIDRKKH